MLTLRAAGYSPDGGRRPSHQGKDAETPTESEGNPTCAGTYTKALTCVNRIGMVATIRLRLNNLFELPLAAPHEGAQDKASGIVSGENACYTILPFICLKMDLH